MPNNRSNLNIEEKLKKTEVAGRIVAGSATIHAATVGYNCKLDQYKMQKNMKNSLVILLISIICISCEKTFLIPEDEVPDWLKESILKDEKIIKSDPKLMQNYGAWIRYEFKGDMFYEYDNPLSSTSRNPYSQDGAIINTTIAPYTEYEKVKCCERFIWKAPKYHELK